MTWCGSVEWVSEGFTTLRSNGPYPIWLWCAKHLWKVISHPYLKLIHYLLCFTTGTWKDWHKIVPWGHVGMVCHFNRKWRLQLKTLKYKCRVAGPCNADFLCWFCSQTLVVSGMRETVNKMMLGKCSQQPTADTLSSFQQLSKPLRIIATDKTHLHSSLFLPVVDSDSVCIFF